LLKSCTLCPRRCKVNRLKDERGYCGVGRELEIASFTPHFGEEDVLVGRGGSGTIFLNSCNLSCIFCQNYDISQLRHGRVISTDDFVQCILLLQKSGCHNINFVTPTHFMPQILEAIFIAQDKGLHLPLVYNCGGYECIESLQLLEGVIDIYMPDVKYADEEAARCFSNAPHYYRIIKDVLKEMHRQVGDLILDENGLAVKGLLIRHLVLPNNVADSESLFQFIAREISVNSYINIMDQYRPYFKSADYPELSRPTTQAEYLSAIEISRSFGLHRGF
jgi:putative pyruvate formate lyase activating enzyme